MLHDAWSDDADHTTDEILYRKCVPCDATGSVHRDGRWVKCTVCNGFREVVIRVVDHSPLTAAISMVARKRT